MWKINKVLAACITCAISINAFAVKVGPYDVRPVATFTGAYAIITPNGQSQRYVFSDGSLFNLRANSSTQHEGLVGLFIGGEYQFQPQFALQLGLGYYQPSPFTVTGTDIQGVVNSPATFNSYAYNYTVNLRQLLVESKALYTWNTRFHPYVSLGLGASFNNAYNYNVNNPPFLTFAPQYRKGNSNNFSYRVGLGVDVDATDNLRFGIGYHYAGYGNVDLGSGQIDNISIPGTLKQSNLNVSEIVGEITLIM